MVAQLDELRRLGGACRLDRAVVAQNAHQLAVHAGVAAHHLGGVTGFELQKVRGVHQPGDDLAHVIGLALVGGDYAHEFLLVKQRLVPSGRCRNGVPAQLVQHLARHGDGVGVVLAQVFAQAGDVGVGLSAAQLVLGAVFAHCGFDQRRAGQKDVGTAAHQDHIVRQARQIRTTRRGRAVYHRDLRQPGGRHARLVGKAAPAFDKYLGLVEQIGAPTFHQVDHGQLVFQGNLLGAQRFAQAHGRHGAAFDGAVVHRHQAALARDHANTHDGAAAQHRLFAIVVVHLQAGQAAEFQKRRAPVQEARQALAWQQLIALLKLGALGLGLGNHLCLQAVDLVKQTLHALGVGGKGGGTGVDLRAQGGGAGDWGHEHRSLQHGTIGRAVGIDWRGRFTAFWALVTLWNDTRETALYGVTLALITIKAPPPVNPRKPL